MTPAFGQEVYGRFNYFNISDPDETVGNAAIRAVAVTTLTDEFGDSHVVSAYHAPSGSTASSVTIPLQRSGNSFIGQISVPFRALSYNQQQHHAAGFTGWPEPIIFSVTVPLHGGSATVDVEGVEVDFVLQSGQPSTNFLMYEVGTYSDDWGPTLRLQNFDGSGFLNSPGGGGSIDLDELLELLRGEEESTLAVEMTGVPGLISIAEMLRDFVIQTESGQSLIDLLDEALGSDDDAESWTDPEDPDPVGPGDLAEGAVGAVGPAIPLAANFELSEPVYDAPDETSAGTTWSLTIPVLGQGRTVTLSQADFAVLGPAPAAAYLGLMSLISGTLVTKELKRR